jgi:tRNA(fMet)-specific endonuclease VapC
VDKALLDTDILSELLKRRDEQVAARATAYRLHHASYTLSSVTVMEVVRGYHAALKREQLAEFRKRLKRAEVLPFTRSTAELAGQIDTDLERVGLTIGRADPMIAATAIENGLVLVTGNVKHFERIQALGYSLRLDNWRAPAGS